MFGENIVYNDSDNNNDGNFNDERSPNPSVQVGRNKSCTPGRNKTKDDQNIPRLVVLGDDSLFENKSKNPNKDNKMSPSNDYSLPPGFVWDSNGIPISTSLLNSSSTSPARGKNGKRINTKKFITKVINSPRQVVLPLVNKLKSGNPRDRNMPKKGEHYFKDHTNYNTGENANDVSTLFNRSSHLKSTQKYFEDPNYIDEEEEECYRVSNRPLESSMSGEKDMSENHDHMDEHNSLETNKEIKQNHEYELSPTLPPPGIGLSVAPSGILYPKDKCQGVDDKPTKQDIPSPFQSTLTQQKIDRISNKNVEKLSKDNRQHSPEINCPPPFPFPTPSSPPPPSNQDTYFNSERNPPPRFPFYPPSPSQNRNSYLNHEESIEKNNFDSNRRLLKRYNEEGSDFFTIEREVGYRNTVNKGLKSLSPLHPTFREKRQIPYEEENTNSLNITPPYTEKKDTRDSKVLTPTFIKGGKKIRRGSTVTVNTLPKYNDYQNENYPSINLGISSPQTFLFGNSDKSKSKDTCDNLELNRKSISGSISSSSPPCPSGKDISREEYQELRYSNGSMKKKENKTSSRLNSGRIALEKRRAHDPYLSLFEKEALRKLDETLIQTCSVQEEEFLREAMGSPNGTREYRIRSHIPTSPPFSEKRETANTVGDTIGNTPLTIDTRLPPNGAWHQNQSQIVQPSAPPTPTGEQAFFQGQDQPQRFRDDQMVHQYKHGMNSTNSNGKDFPEGYGLPNSSRRKLRNNDPLFSNEYDLSPIHKDMIYKESPSMNSYRASNFSPLTPSPHHNLRENRFENSFTNGPINRSHHHTINTPYASPPPPSRPYEAGNFVPNRKRKIVLIEFSLSDWLRNRFHQMSIDERIARAALHVNDAIFERPSRLRVLGKARTRLYTFINDRLWSGFMIFIASLYMILSLWEPPRRGPVTNDGYYVSWTMPKSIEDYIDLRMDLLSVETCIVGIFFIDIILGIVALGIPDYLGLREQLSVLEGLSTKALYEIIVWTWIKLILAIVFIIDIAIVFDYGPFENQPWWSRIFRPLYVIALSRDLQRWCILLGKTMYRLRDFILVMITVLGLWSLLALLLFQGSNFYTRTTISGVTLTSYSNPTDIALRGGLPINGGDCPGPSCYYTGGVDGASYSWEKKKIWIQR